MYKRQFFLIGRHFLAVGFGVDVKLQVIFIVSAFDLRAHHKPDNHRSDNQHKGQKLGNTDAAEQQAVGAEPLDDSTAQTVPGGIHQKQLAVELAVLAVKKQQQKAQGTPEGFIEEAREMCIRDRNIIKP